MSYEITLLQKTNVMINNTAVENRLFTGLNLVYNIL